MMSDEPESQAFLHPPVKEMKRPAASQSREPSPNRWNKTAQFPVPEGAEVELADDGALWRFKPQKQESLSNTPISEEDERRRVEAKQEEAFTKFVIDKLKEEWLSIGADEPASPDLDAPTEEQPEEDGADAETVLGPLEALKAKIDRVRETGSVDPSSVDDIEPLTTNDLINMVADDPPGSAVELEEAVRAIKGEARRRFSEQLNVELAELKNSRGMAGEDLKREQQVEYLLGLFARVGEI